jgi:hypothetical protein
MSTANSGAIFALPLRFPYAKPGTFYSALTGEGDRLLTGDPVGDDAMLEWMGVLLVIVFFGLTFLMVAGLERLKKE